MGIIDHRVCAYMRRAEEYAQKMSALDSINEEMIRILQREDGTPVNGVGGPLTHLVCHGSLKPEVQ